MTSFIKTSVWLLVAVFLSNCNTQKPKDEKVLKINFAHHFDGAPVTFDRLQYENGAGNLIEVTEVQWFISDVRIDNQSIAEENIHYIDTNLPNTLSWTNSIPEFPENPSKFQFVFGIRGSENTIGRFANPPEVNMIWPMHMGGDNGGYHYMKLNGFWEDRLQSRVPFNFHLGVGQLKNSDGSSKFIQNWFEVELPLENVDLSENPELTLVMNMENWFQTPNLWNFDDVGGKIMDNQNAMKMACENGKKDVFTLKKP